MHLTELVSVVASLVRGRFHKLFCALFAKLFTGVERKWIELSL